MADSFWMITNREKQQRTLRNSEGGLSYRATRTPGRLDRLNAWRERTASQFRKELMAEAENFPDLTTLTTTRSSIT